MTSPFNRLRAMAFVSALGLAPIPSLAQAQEAAVESVPAAPAPAPATVMRTPVAEAPEEAKQAYWGVGIGYVFNRIPISLSTFNVLMSNVWYSHILGNPNDQTRLAATVGFYGFQLLLPVPRASLDYYVGRPSQDLQFKGGVGGFYDVAVGGHGGVAGELGIVIKNRLDMTFMAVPLGTDSKRSYAEFMGLKSQKEADEDYKEAGNKWVELPYYGVFLGVRF